MTARQAWLMVAVFTVLTAWFLVGAVVTVTRQAPTPSTWYSGPGDAVEVTP
jgi:hypothetical protein